MRDLICDVINYCFEAVIEKNPAKEKIGLKKFLHEFRSKVWSTV